MYIEICKSKIHKVTITDANLQYVGSITIDEALMDAARAGCTTIIDHHASPSCVDGSLDQVERAFRGVGLSGCLSYEVSDRNREGEGIEENERWIRKCREFGDGQMAGLVGVIERRNIDDGQ